MTVQDEERVKELIAEYMASHGAALDNTSEVPIEGDISQGVGTTIPVVKRVAGQVDSYGQMTLTEMGRVVAPYVPAEDLGYMEGITEEEFNNIFYPESE